MNKPLKWVLVLVMTSVPVTHAQDRGDNRALSVYEIKPWVDGPLLGAAALGATIPILMQDQIVTRQCSPCDPGEVNRFDRHVIAHHSVAASWVSHFTVTAAIAVPLYLDYKDLGWNQTLAEDFIVYAEVLAINSSLSNLARYTTQRPRPSAYRRTPNPDDTGAFLSFYSGHAASAIAALSAASMTYGYRYGHRVWPWVVTGSVGIIEAGLRSAAGKHFHTDNIVGLIMGTAVGTLVPMMHKRHAALPVTLVPANRGAELVWRHDF